MSHTNKISFKTFAPVIIIFILVTCFVMLFRDKLVAWKVSQSVLLGGNTLLFGVTLCSWIFHSKALNAGNTQAFLRNVYSAMMIKLLVCIVAFFIYISYAGKQVNKPALFSVMFLYLIYTFLELSILMKYSKRNNNNA